MSFDSCVEESLSAFGGDASVSVTSWPAAPCSGSLLKIFGSAPCVSKKMTDVSESSEVTGTNVVVSRGGEGGSNFNS